MPKIAKLIKIACFKFFDTKILTKVLKTIVSITILICLSSSFSDMFSFSSLLQPPYSPMLSLKPHYLEL